MEMKCFDWWPIINDPQNVSSVNTTVMLFKAIRRLLSLLIPTR